MDQSGSDHMRWGSKRYFVARVDGDTLSGTATDDARALVGLATIALDDGARFVMVIDEENDATVLLRTRATVA